MVTHCGMTHPLRFFAPFEPHKTVSIALPSDEAHHALRVARIKSGSSVSVLNGKGYEAIGVLIDHGKHGATVEVSEWIYHEPPPIAITLGVGQLQHDKAHEEIIQRAVEIGVSRIFFWQADRSQKPTRIQRRWIRTAIESCKQCGRYHVPDLETVSSLDIFLEHCPRPALIALPEMKCPPPVSLTIENQLALVVGPEGDFSERERTLALSHGLVPVSLGTCIYRSEVAASLLMTVTAHLVGLLGPPLHLTIRDPKDRDS